VVLARRSTQPSRRELSELPSSIAVALTAWASVVVAVLAFHGLGLHEPTWYCLMVLEVVPTLARYHDFRQCECGLEARLLEPGDTLETLQGLTVPYDPPVALGLLIQDLGRSSFRVCQSLFRKPSAFCAYIRVVEFPSPLPHGILAYKCPEAGAVEGLQAFYVHAGEYRGQILRTYRNGALEWEYTLSVAEFRVIKHCWQQVLRPPSAD
jgi:hypothetical protein